MLTWYELRCYFPSNALIFQFFSSGCIEGDVRLINGNNVLEGIPQICVGNVWGKICSENWDVNDARVLCRQLGFTSAGRLIKCND